MRLTDTHAHIYEENYADDRDRVISEAISQGIDRIIMPNIDAETVEMMLQVSRKYPENCFPMIGLQPGSVQADYIHQLDSVFSWIGKEKFVGIGEIGIDLYWDKTYFKEQQDAFRQQLRTAREVNLPVSIHVRNSFEEVYSILEEEQNGSLTGIFHCFSGGKEEAEKIIRAGFYLGIGGVVTFKNSSLAWVLKDVALQNLVLETDAPYLSPVPFRGKRNECSWLWFIAEKLASVYQVPVEEVARITTGNALSLFKV
jgi:TatD DNase family protein